MTETMPFAATVADAVKLSGINRTELYRLLGEGAIKAKKSGRRTLIMMDSVLEYVQSLPNLELRGTILIDAPTPTSMRKMRACL